MEINSNRILHITNNDFDGEGHAVLRLHNGLLELGANSKVLVLQKKTKGKHIHSLGYCDAPSTLLSNLIKSFFYLDIGNSLKFLRFILFKLKVKYLHLKHKPISLFNFGVRAISFNELAIFLRDTDILVLHGVHDILSPNDVYRIHKNFSLKIFFHILDIEPITGGCHFNFECKKYMIDCKDCPQIYNNSIASTTLDRKKELYKKIPINWIVPNTSTLDILKKSYIFDKSHTASIIFMGIESNRYKKIDKDYAKDKLNLPDKPVILFGCFNFSDKRKGAHILKQSLSGRYVDKSKLINLHLVTFGELNDFSFKGIIPQWTHLGTIKSSEEMNILYRSSDLLASPSIDDIGPATVVEAFMNHLPVVAFDIGVAKDLVKNNVNGSLVPCFNIEKFALSILGCLLESDSLNYKNNKELLLYKKRCTIRSEARELLMLACE
jgi:glycosyltransferase involved in cell wall biosynthesis